MWDMQRWQSGLLGFAAFTLLSAILGITLLIRMVPDRKTIAHALAPRASQLRSTGTLLTTTQTPARTQPLKAALTRAPLPSPSASPIPSTTPIADRGEGIGALMEEPLSDTRVCENLGNPVNPSLGSGTPSLPNTAPDPASPSPKSGASFDAVLSAPRTDAVAEAYRMPLKAVFQDPDLAPIFREIRDVQAETTGESANQKESFLDKLGFYQRVVAAGSNAMDRQEQYEELGDRANHLATLARLALLRPTFASDARVTDLCRRIESAGASRLSSDDIRSERADVIGLLRDFGVNPADVGFAPNQWTKFHLQADRNGIHFTMNNEATTDARGAVEVRAVPVVESPEAADAANSNAPNPVSEASVATPEAETPAVPVQLPVQSPVPAAGNAPAVAPFNGNFPVAPAQVAPVPAAQPFVPTEQQFHAPPPIPTGTNVLVPIEQQFRPPLAP